MFIQFIQSLINHLLLSLPDNNCQSPSKHSSLSAFRRMTSSKSCIPRQKAAGLLLLAGLLMFLTTSAHCQVEGGDWVPEFPSFKIHEKGCGVVNGSTFRLTNSDPSSKGYQRAERRYQTYTDGGTHQFEGWFRITDMNGTRICLKQTFKDYDSDGHGAGPYFLLAVEKGGRLYVVHDKGQPTIATGATVGTMVRINTVHRVGVSHKTYVNGSLRHVVPSSGGNFYHKLGVYATASGHGPITVEWSGMKFWRKP